MIDPIAVKSELLWHLRTVLRQRGFHELHTPIARRSDDKTGRRALVDVGGPKQLRSMIGPALRHNLQFHPRIFEIGPCFRADPADQTHSPEFWMLDLYAAGETFPYLFALAEQLVQPFTNHPFQRLSIADHIADTFGIDLRAEPTEIVAHQLARAVDVSADVPLLEILERYIGAVLEPLSAGKALFLHDFPLGGNEPCAKLQDGTAAVLNRFELIIDGVEVVHGYQDETDNEAFIKRAQQVNLYNEEQDLIQREIAPGRVPAHSVGLGIGIERLCMAATGITDIAAFQQSPAF
jgi:elongation factor P--beta-lysine ligase